MRHYENRPAPKTRAFFSLGRLGRSIQGGPKTTLSCFTAGILILFCVLCPAFQTNAAPLAFSSTLEGAPTTVMAEAYDVQQVVYVSLSDLVKQLGGAIQVMPARVLVDLRGASAIAGMNNTQISTAQSSFSVTYPVVQHEGDALLAAADVEAFFIRAFSLAVTPLQARSPEEVSAPPTEQAQREPDPSAPAIASSTDPAPQPLADEVSENALAPPSLLAQESTEALDLLEPVALSEAGETATIVLDAGHGGHDLGVNGPGGLLEKDLTLALSKAIATHLKQETAFKVVLTRKGEEDLSLPDRAEIANKAEAALFISLHAGASYAPQAHGVEFFYPSEHGAKATGSSRSHTQRIRKRSETSRRLAKNLAATLPASGDMQVRGVHALPLLIFRRLEAPGVLIEVGCLSSADEEARLSQQGYRNELARSIAFAVATALKGNPETGRQR